MLATRIDLLREIVLLRTDIAGPREDTGNVPLEIGGEADTAEAQP